MAERSGRGMVVARSAQNVYIILVEISTTAKEHSLSAKNFASLYALSALGCALHASAAFDEQTTNRITCTHRMMWGLGAFVCLHRFGVCGRKLLGFSCVCVFVRGRGGFVG